MRALLGLPVLIVAAALACPAAAHVALRYPPSRYGDFVLKEGPCGVAGGTRSRNVTELASGAQIVVVWDEYVNHPGHFRIAFDDDGDDDLIAPSCLSGCDTGTPEIQMYANGTVLLDGIADTPYGGQSSATVTLPDVECDRCTLQLIQVMYDKPPYTIPGDDIYYQCADLVLRRAPSPATTSTPSATPTATPTAPSPTPTSIPSTASTTPISTPVSCVGDCDNRGTVTVDELVQGVNIALGDADMSTCPQSDTDGSGTVTIDELVTAVNAALNGCGG